MSADSTARSTSIIRTEHKEWTGMDILESVRRSSGMIGIISHVQLLESNIPTHLEVIKTNGGSTIVPA